MLTKCLWLFGLIAQTYCSNSLLRLIAQTLCSDRLLGLIARTQCSDSLLRLIAQTNCSESLFLLVAYCSNHRVRCPSRNNRYLWLNILRDRPNLICSNGSFRQQGWLWSNTQVKWISTEMDRIRAWSFPIRGRRRRVVRCSGDRWSACWWLRARTRKSAPLTSPSASIWLRLGAEILN